MIRKANKTDISWMVNLSYQKRLAYEKMQPNFWKISENSNEIQKKYFEKELKNKNVIEVIASVTNVYNRNNIFYVNRVSGKEIYQFPLLPSFGLSYKF